MRQPSIPCLEPLSSGPSSAGNGDADDATPRAFAAVRGWRPPLNWSLQDWYREARAIIAAASCRAELAYDPERGVPRAAFVYKRTVASVWTRYRQEWAYALLFAAAPSIISEQPVSTLRAPNDSAEGMDRLVCEVLNQLPPRDRQLIRQLFWDRKTEHQLAETLGVSQQAISKRKGRALQRLRRACNGRLAVLSQFLAAATAFFDSLDLFSAADFWL